LTEPPRVQIRWQGPASEKPDRLASPLIVKALPLADGKFSACALWLNRAYPTGQVVLHGVKGSSAPFDLLVAPGDTPRFLPLDQKATLRDAFLDWLRTRPGTQVVAP